MSASLLAGVRVVSTALNLPGPAACARLRDLGAAVTKVEPPSGDPMRKYCADWYGRLHDGMSVETLDLKSASGAAYMETLLANTDVLVTAQRNSALARLRLDAASLARHPQLCHVAITGHAPPEDEIAGHDLTYMAAHGLVRPPEMPPTLFADLMGAERAVSTVLAMLVERARSGRGGCIAVPLEEAAAALAAPLREGLTQHGALLGGGFAGYNLYAASDGWVAVAALEPHFARRLAHSLQLQALTVEALRERFALESVAHWVRWARERDLPIAAVQLPLQKSS